MRKNVLIVCRDITEANQLGLIVPQQENTYILASDDPRVHKVSKNYVWINEACWICQMDSYHVVAADVVSTLKRINEWLKVFGNDGEIHADLLYWIVHCEGGDTTQRVLDLLLMNRFYTHLINNYSPVEILVFKSGQGSWENDLLEQCADRHDVKLAWIGLQSFVNWFNKIFWVHWRPLIAEIYHSIKIFKVKLSNYFIKRPEIEKKHNVAVQIINSEKKHLNHSLPILKAVQEVGFQGVAVCWKIGALAEVLRKEGYTFTELESYLTLKDILNSWWFTFKTMLRAFASIDGFLPTNIESEDINFIRELLIPSVRIFFIRDLPDRFRYDVACKKYFKNNPPLALRLFSLVLPEGLTISRALPAFSNTIKFIRGGWPYTLAEPITNSTRGIACEELLFFACGKEHKKILVGQGYPENNIVEAGLHWIEQISLFKKKNNKQVSRRALNLRLDAEFYMFFDANSIVLGYLSPQEQYSMLNAVLELARDNTSLELIIKPHPSHAPGILESIINEFALDNVSLVSSHELPYHALNAADILVTKFSTIALEGMVLDIPGIGLLLDKEEHFKLYENSLDYMTDLDSFKQKVTRLINDQIFREEWFKKMRSEQDDFLNRHGLSFSADAALIAAQTIKMLVENNKYKSVA